MVVSILSTSTGLSFIAYGQVSHYQINHLLSVFIDSRALYRTLKSLFQDICLKGLLIVDDYIEPKKQIDYTGVILCKLERLNIKNSKDNYAMKFQMRRNQNFLERI